MNAKFTLLLSTAGICALLAGGGGALAQGAPAALSGRVSMAQGGPIEGVLVSAQMQGSTITTTVVSDAQGRFSFPADRLAPGSYLLSIRAVGYDLKGPTSAQVAAGKDADVDLTLSKTKDLADQLSNAEWLDSFPVPDAQKAFMTDCDSCHTLRRPADSTFTDQQFPDIIKLMASFSAESMPSDPQLLPPGPRNRMPKQAFLDKASKVLSTINLSKGSRTYPLKTLPLPKGSATQVIITTYKLPRPNWMPHDVILDKEGNVWFSDFSHQRVGEMDPKTGKVTIIRLPLLKPDTTQGSLDMELDPQGNVWVAMMYQGGVAEIDDKTHAVKVFKIPAKFQNFSTQESFVSPEHSNVDGYVWTNDQDKHTLIRLDMKTGKFGKMISETTPQGLKVNAYQIPTDQQNNVYLLNFGGTLVGYVDRATDVVDGFKTPSPASRPRRGEVDSQNRLWFAEFGANRIGMYDRKSKKFTEWELPTKWSDPYDVAYSSKFDEVWAGSMQTDMVDRLNVQTGRFTEYLLPEKTNIRRVYLDSRGPRPILWIGNNHGASIMKVEPLK